MYRRILMISLLALATAAVVVGCGGEAKKVVVTISDNEGKAPAREITVAYVNDRIDHMPPNLLPDTEGEQGKKDFIDEIIRKELLVIDGYRLGIPSEPQYEQMRQLYTDDKARQMFVQEFVYDKAEPTEEEIARHRVLRETKITLDQIVVPTKDEAWDAYHRIVEGGEDFEAVAREVSTAHTAAQGGRMEPKMWIDFHPVVMMQITDLKPGDITEPTDIGGAYHIYKVIDRVEPKDLKEPTAADMNSIASEARTWKRTVREDELNKKMQADANIAYNDKAMDVLSKKMADKIAEVIPDNVEEMSFDDRMEIARKPIVPDFTDDESKMQLLSYVVGGKEKDWTLGDFRDILENTPGIEGPKVSDAYGLKLFIWRKVREDLIQDEIARKKYKDTKELKDYVDQKLEEYIVNVAYQRDVSAKVDEPSGQEIREYFQSHREDYAEPPKVDLRMLVVASEGEANLYRQMIESGKATFTDLVKKYSVEQWSKSRDGLIENYYQGERKLGYLQDVVFDLPVGQISDPFPAPGGYAIVKVLKKYPERQREFSELGDTVKNDMLTIRREAKLDALLEQIRQSVQIDWSEQNLALVKDIAEAKKEKEANRLVVTS